MKKTNMLLDGFWSDDSGRADLAATRPARGRRRRKKKKRSSSQGGEELNGKFVLAP
jgi:hypothetical protein